MSSHGSSACLYFLVLKNRFKMKNSLKINKGNLGIFGFKTKGFPTPVEIKICSWVLFRFLSHFNSIHMTKSSLDMCRP